MILNDVPENREAFDQVERSLEVDRRRSLLRRLGPQTDGLRCWAFGPGWEARSVAELADSEIEKFVNQYA